MDHFDGGAIDDQGSAAIWEWQSPDYYGLQKDADLLPDPSSSLWDLEYQFCDRADPCTSLWAEASNNLNVGDDWSMLDVQTPFKQCADFEYHFCDIGDIIVKDFEEGNETLQAKRRRMLQFSPENVEMTRPMIEGGLSQSLQVMNSSGTSSLLKSDGTDELPEESLVNCLQDVEACFPVEEMNTHVVAMEKAVDISAGKNIVTRKEPRTYVAYPFESIKPSSIHGEVTLNDINDMIKAKPPHKIKHKNGEEPNSFQASAISGKPVVHKRRIHAPPPHKIKHGNDEEPNSFQASAISGKPVVHKRRIHTKGKWGNGTIITINCACFLCCGKAK